MLRFDRQFIGGEWRSSAGDELVLHDPATESPAALVRLGTAADARAAVSSAAAAFANWSGCSIQARAAILAKAAGILSREAESIAVELAREIGTPIADARRLHVEPAVRLLSKAPEWAAEPRLAETYIGRTLVKHVPIGVAACITPWNYPLYLAAQKVAPALLAGATVVLKPSEIAPGSIVRLTRALQEAGLPAGALNVVFGNGVEVGETLVTAPQVSVVSFTGSTAVGRRVAQLAGSSLKKVSLELGGKSACVALPDADLAPAIAATLQKCIQNSGQTCAALTRLLVPDQQFDEACAIAAELASRARVGNPLDPQTQVGPLINERQQQRALEILSRALERGARCLAGGIDRPKELQRGYFISPTVLATRDPNIEIAQTEAFAPILTVLPYRDEEHAVEIANGTVYGLSGAVWSSDESRALTIAARLRAGSISINGAPTHPEAPFGGFDESGFGRERGPYALDTFMTTQALNR